jgi:hypothetical protein
LKYAARREKQFLFIVEQNNQIEKEHLPAWIATVMARSLVITISGQSEDLFTSLYLSSGLHTIDVLAAAIRKLVAFQRKLESAFTDADADDENSGGGDGNGNASGKCVFCGLSLTSTQPCRRHTAYFVGGTIIAGRWVCCESTEKDSVGCSDHAAGHAPARLWTEMEGFSGCFQWK